MRYLIVCLMFCVSMLSLGAFAQSGADGAVLSPMQFNWIAPTQREDGTALTTTEIGGYQLRYKLRSASAHSVVTIPSGSANSYLLSGIGAGDYEYQIVVYDKDGLYSGWVTIVPSVAARPKPVTGATAKRQGVDVKAACVAPACKVAVKGEYK
jgi:hypothetical protein